MRYGFAELTLALPFGPVYRPATDTPRAREVRRRAYHDRDAGIHMGDWPAEEKEAWKEDLRGYGETLRVYMIARHPERIAVPPSWPEEIALLVTGAALAACSDNSLTLRALWRMLALRPVRRLHSRVWRTARERRARRLGLTPANAPEVRMSPHVWTWLALFPMMLWRERHVRRSSWELYLAAQIIRALNERRSYRAALKRR